MARRVTPVLTVTESELLAALHAAGAAPEEARTVQEMCELSGWGESKVRKTLAPLARAGRVRTHWVERVRLDGHRTKVPAYTILPASAAA